MSGRISQEVIETLQLPGTSNVLVTQQFTEAAMIPMRSGVNTRVTQEFIEALMIPARTPTDARITQQFIEVLYIPGILTGTWATEEFYWQQRAAVTLR